MQIAINTADDERHTLEIVTCLDLISFTLKPIGRLMLSSASPSLADHSVPHSGLRGSVTQTMRSTQERCRCHSVFHRTATVPWISTCGLAMETFLNVVFF